MVTHYVKASRRTRVEPESACDDVVGAERFWLLESAVNKILRFLT